MTLAFTYTRCRHAHANTAHISLAVSSADIHYTQTNKQKRWYKRSFRTLSLSFFNWFRSLWHRSWFNLFRHKWNQFSSCYSLKAGRHCSRCCCCRRLWPFPFILFPLIHRHASLNCVISWPFENLNPFPIAEIIRIRICMTVFSLSLSASRRYYKMRMLFYKRVIQF